jgi:hypothetical protein
MERIREQGPSGSSLPVLPVRVANTADESGETGGMMEEAQRVIATTAKNWEVER